MSQYSTESAISISNLGKWFNTTSRKDGFRETLVGAVKKQKIDKSANGFWALRNVTFEVKRGEVMGIIGHNGAGKSMLLKILTGITTPTEGQAEIRGRIGALLELGTGFHSELSGYDNIFLNGSFLGMKPWEIEEKLEEIIKFSGISYAINEPVKHYSSGMTMRLAFSIAVTLAPEIIFLDEVWAVGDMDFQKRAFDKIRKIISDGRTVMIVSHSLDTISSISTSCVLLDHGKIIDMGDSRKIIRSYLNSVTKSAILSTAANTEKPVEKKESKKEESKTEEKVPEIQKASPQFVNSEIGSWSWGDSVLALGTERITLRQVNLYNSEGDLTEKFFIGEDITVEFIYEQADPNVKFIFGIGVKDLYGSFILANSSEKISTWNDNNLTVLPSGLRSTKVTIPGKVCSMSYTLAIIIGGTENFKDNPDIMLTDMIRFDVLPKKYDDQYPLNFSGAIPLDLEWKTRSISSISEVK